MRKFSFTFSKMPKTEKEKKTNTDTPKHGFKGDVEKPFIFFLFIINWAAPYKNMSLGIRGERRHRSACASAQSD